MSITNCQGEKLDLGVDKSSLAVREALAQMSVDEIRAFIVNLMRFHKVPLKNIAKAMNCSERTVRRYGEAFT